MVPTYTLIISGFKDTAAATLSACAALAEPARGGLEILFVDNTRDGRHAGVVLAAAKTDERIQYIPVPAPGKAAAQNVALSKCRGRYIVCLDDDVLPDSGLLQEYDRAFAAYPCAAVQGRVELLFEGHTVVPSWLDHRLRLDLAEMDFGKAIHPFGMGLTGANMAFRREVFDRYGVFDERLGPGRTGTLEDQEFSERLRAGGETQLFWPGASVRHRIPSVRLRVRSFARIHYDVGYSDYLLSRHLVKGGPLKFGIYSARMAGAHLVKAAVAWMCRDLSSAVYSYCEVFRCWGYYRSFRVHGP